MEPDVTISGVAVAAFRIPTDAPEADGTISWDSTGLVVAEVAAGGRSGLGYTYAAPRPTATLVADTLAPLLQGRNAMDVDAAWAAMISAVRNIGWRGIAANAISALDVALWDLKARLLGVPLVTLFGAVRDTVPIYGSGGFTSYADGRLAEQLGGWVADAGCRWVKMKVGSRPEDDPRRIRVARETIGSAGLMIDANGAFDRKPARRMAEAADELDVEWFEEPVSSDDLEGLRLLRDRAPARMQIAAGEYGYEPFYFRRMLAAGAVDVLQADATRCCGYTGFLRAAALAEACSVPLSAHTAPALHLPVCCAAPGLLHLEWFHDHVRIEQMLLEGAPVPCDGAVAPDRSRPGHGLSVRHADAKRFALQCA